MGRSRRLELPTSGTTNRRSNQLSYDRHDKPWEPNSCRRAPLHKRSTIGRENWQMSPKPAPMQSSLSEQRELFNQPWIGYQGLAVTRGRNMAAKLQLESAAVKPPHKEKRRISRFLASSRVLVRSSHGDSCKAQLKDVSIFGCLLQTNAEWLRTGMFVSINLSSDWSIQAIVRWARNGSAGVEFLRSISEADALEIARD